MMEAVLKNGNLIHINGAGYGYISHSERFEFIPIPDQDVSKLFKWVETDWELIGTLKDLTLYASEGEYPKTVEQRLRIVEDDVKGLIETKNR